jgi:NTE family protein
MKKRKKLGVALGGGGVRGLYHVGVLWSLQKNNIPIDYLAGSSIGAWVGGFYALQKDLKQLEELTSGHKIEKLVGLFEFSLSGGLIKGDKLQKLLDEWLGHAQFKDMNIPFRAVATNLADGKEVVFKKGDLATALRASMAIPGAFAPVTYRKQMFIDGGLSNPVPDDVVKRMGADVILAVDLLAETTPLPSKNKQPSIMDTMSVAIDIVCRHLAVATTKDADIILRPKLGKYASYTDYFLTDKGMEAIALGEQETNKIIPELKRKLEG